MFRTAAPRPGVQNVRRHALTVRGATAQQAPAANHKGSQRALEETFRLTNISPQVGKGFNRYVFIFLCGRVAPRSLMQRYRCRPHAQRDPLHGLVSCRDYWARFEHFVKKLTDTCEEVWCA